MKKLYQDRNTFKSTQICAYVDDRVVIARDILSLNSEYMEIEHEARNQYLIVMRIKQII